MRGPEAELRSLMFQVGRVRKGPVPTDSVRERARRLLYDSYHEAGVSFCSESTYLGWDLTDAGIRLRVESIVDSGRIKSDANPGVPLVDFAKTNGNVIEDFRELLIELCCARLRLWRDTPHSYVLGLSPQQMIELGLADAVRLFVKNEPHSREKLEQGRFRLISSMSLINQVCERFLYTELNDREVDHWDVCPSAIGIGFTNDMNFDVWRRLYAVPRKMQNDVSGWDFNVYSWKAMDATEVNIQLVRASEMRANMMRNATWAIMNKVFALSDGRLLMTDGPGIMTSGSFITGQLNSKMRQLAKVHAALRNFPDLERAPFGTACGDDCIEQLVPGESLEQRVAAYTWLGFRLTDVAEVDKSFEFCSHFYLGGSIAPLTTWPRCFYRLICNQPALDLMAQFKFELRHNLELGPCLEVLAAIGWIPPNPAEVLGGVRVQTVSVRLARTKLFEVMSNDNNSASGEKLSRRKARKEAAKADAAASAVSRSAVSRQESSQPATRFAYVLTESEEVMYKYLKTVLHPDMKDQSSLSGPPYAAGSFELYTRLFHVTQSGIATADANGNAWIGVPCNDWIESGNNTGVPDPACRTLGYLGGGTSAVFTDGSAAIGALLPVATTAFVAGQSSISQRLPDDTFNGSTRCRLVAQKLSIRSDASADTGQGEAMLVSSVNPLGGINAGSLNMGAGANWDALIETNDMVLIKAVTSLANWPAGHELGIVAIPAEQQCFEMTYVPPNGYANVPYFTMAMLARGCKAGQKISFTLNQIWESEMQKTNEVGRMPSPVPSEPYEYVNKYVSSAKPMAVSTSSTPQNLQVVPWVGGLAKTRPEVAHAVVAHPAIRPVIQQAVSAGAVTRPSSSQSGGFLNTLKNIAGTVTRTGVLGAIPYVGPLVQGIASGLSRIFNW